MEWYDDDDSDEEKIMKIKRKRTNNSKNEKRFRITEKAQKKFKKSNLSSLVFDIVMQFRSFLENY